MRITKRQLRKIIREALLHKESILHEDKKGGMFAKLVDILGIGPEVATRKAEAYKNLQASALEYIDEFEDAEVGPFLKRGGDGDSRRGVTVDYAWQKELHTKKYPEDVKKSIIDQARALTDIINTYAKEAKVDKDADDIPLDAQSVRTAQGMPGLYATMEKSE